MKGNFDRVTRCSSTTSEDGGSYSSKSIFMSSAFSWAIAPPEITKKKSNQALFISNRLMTKETQIKRIKLGNFIQAARHVKLYGCRGAQNNQKSPILLMKC